VIPRSSGRLDAEIPASYQFWTPRREDITEEGFAFFRDTWLIRGVSVREARSLLRLERELVAVVDVCSGSPEEFDEIANALGVSDLDEIPVKVLQSSAFEPIADYYSDGDQMSLVEGLDLGVAGLVYALAAVGCWPAASCRGHAVNGWSDSPVVYLAADRHRTMALQPLVEAAGCGFDLDPARRELLLVIGPSVLEMMTLAEAVLEVRSTFTPRRGPRVRKPPAAGTQLGFDIQR
jgi:hypothetical protein